MVENGDGVSKKKEAAIEARKREETAVQSATSWESEGRKKEHPFSALILY